MPYCGILSMAGILALHILINFFWPVLDHSSELNFLLLFWGPEGFLINITGLQNRLLTPPDSNFPPHVISPPMGWLQNEIGAYYHLTLPAAKTCSGIMHISGCQSLFQSKTQDYYNVPAFCDLHGNITSAQDYGTEIFIDFRQCKHAILS